MRKLLTAALVLGLGFSSAGAVTVSGGAGAWREKPSGWIEYTENNVGGTGVTATTEVDVKDDLHVGDETKAFGWFEIKDIPVPLVPDLKVRYTPMKFTGSGYATTTFTFGDITVPAGTRVDSKLEANQVDVTLSYGLPLIETATAGKAELNLGLNVKVIDGYAKVRYLDPTSGWKEDSKSATIPVPMVHLNGELRPVGLVALDFEANWIGYSGSQFYDLVGELKVYPHKNLFLGVGYRYQRLKIDDISDVSADLKVKGAFFEAGFTF